MAFKYQDMQSRHVVQNTLVIYDDKFDRLNGITCKLEIQGQDLGYNL